MQAPPTLFLIFQKNTLAFKEFGIQEMSQMEMSSTEGGASLRDYYRKRKTNYLLPEQL